MIRVKYLPDKYHFCAAVVGWLRMQEEVDAIMDCKSFVEYEDLTKLKYCGQVFKETLRLYPPAPATARENLEEVTVDGFRIPANSWIIVRRHFE